MRQNLLELPELVRRAAEWGMESVFVQHLSHDFGESGLPERYRPMRDFVQDQTLLREEPARLEHYFGLARDAAQAATIDLRLPRTQPRVHAPGTPGPARCSWPWRGAYVSYDGFAMPCCMVSTPDRIQLGNMSRDGVAAVWDGEAYRSFRAELASEEPPEICRSCSLYHGTF